MKRTILAGILAMAAGIACLAQAPAGKPPAPPKAKSQEEAKAIQAMMAAVGPDAIIKAADDLQTKFVDTQFKELALSAEANAYRSKGDPDSLIKAQIYGEQTLALNPANVDANMLIAEIIIQTTAARALDREEQLAKAQKCLTAAQDGLKNLTKPDSRMPDTDWASVKQENSARIHNDFGMLASTRKNWDVAITEFKAAIADGDQPTYQARLAATYLQAGRNAEAIALCDKVLADPFTGVPEAAVAQIKKYVSTVKAQAVKAAAAKAAPATTPPAAATPAPAPPK
jgi:tetratricopeptide (TPR) repeat protein